jgi:hypothetical protein
VAEDAETFLWKRRDNIAISVEMEFRTKKEISNIEGRQGIVEANHLDTSMFMAGRPIFEPIICASLTSFGRLTPEEVSKWQELSSDESHMSNTKSGEQTLRVVPV